MRIRAFLQIVLFAIFISYFGLPAVKKYRKMDVIMVNSMENTDGIPIPAITIDIADTSGYESCLFKNASTVKRCLDESVKNWTPTVRAIVLGYKERKNISLKADMIQEGFSHTYSGSLLTLKLPYKIGPDDMEDQLFIKLDPKFDGKYGLYFHDPEFFICNENPGAESILYTRKVSGLYYPLELTEVIELDVPMDPCNSNVGYSFGECIKRTVASQVFKRRNANFLDTDHLVQKKLETKVYFGRP